MKEFLEKLEIATLKVISEEQLPVPTKISFRYSDMGTKTKKGSCCHRKFHDTYSIIINMVEPKYVPDPNGPYLRESTGERLRRVTGRIYTEEEVTKTMAHEIAHLKHWQHDIKHKCYTNHIMEKLYEELNV